MKIKNIELYRFAKNVFWCYIEYDNKKFNLDLTFFEDCKNWLKEIPYASIEAKFFELSFTSYDFPMKEIYRLRFYTKHEDELDVYLLKECKIEAKSIREKLDAIYKHDKKVKPEDWENEVSGCLLVEGDKNRYRIPFDFLSKKDDFSYTKSMIIGKINRYEVITEETATSLVREALQSNSNWREYPPPDFNPFTSYDPFSEELPIPKIPKYGVMYLSPYFKQLIYNKKEV
jgi:hypothetical protein